MDAALLISLILLIAVIVFILWWYGAGRRKTASGAPPRRDKLTLISGIGPTLEQKLNELGVTRFRQIAEFTEEDIERVDRELAFKGRIQREGWVAQARKLAESESRPAPARGKTGTDRAARKATKKKSGKKKASMKNR